jgi:hypothetical protein
MSSSDYQRSPSRRDAERYGFRTAYLGVSRRLVIFGVRTNFRPFYPGYQRDNEFGYTPDYEPGNIYRMKGYLNRYRIYNCGSGLHFCPDMNHLKKCVSALERIQRKYVGEKHVVSVAALASETVIPLSAYRKNVKARALHLFVGTNSRQCIRLVEKWLADETDPGDIRYV